MRIAVNGRFLTQPISGVQRVGVEFLEALDSMLTDGSLPELEVDVFVPRGARLITKPDWNRVKLARAGAFGGHLWEQFTLPRVTRGIPLLCLGNIAPVARLVRRNNYTFTLVHDLSYKYFPAAYRWQFRAAYGLLVPLALRRSDAIFTVSESERTAMRRAYPRTLAKQNIVVAPNGGYSGSNMESASKRTSSSSARDAAIPDRDERDYSGIYVGSLNRRKNADRLLEAARRISNSRNCEFVFIGGTGEGLEKVNRKEALELDSRIRFMGQVDDRSKVADQMRRALFMLFPSLYESSGLPPLEAMALGCPVVVADIPALRERCGDAALYCDPMNIESMVSQSLRLLDEPGLWEALQARGLARAKLFTWRAQVECVMREILAETGGKPDSKRGVR